MNFKTVPRSIEEAIIELFSDYQSGISSREDSRAFGAMIEKRITTNWRGICERLNYEYVELPGKRTIFDFACKVEERLFGFDIKTKDLDTVRYSDGGVCAVGNLLKFLANDKGVFVLVEFGHTKSTVKNSGRDLEYISVAPFHILPENCYRIENLGTGQVRLNYSLNQVWDGLDWNRSFKDFFDMFTDLAILHYKRVSRDAHKRIKSMEAFSLNNSRHKAPKHCQESPPQRAEISRGERRLQGQSLLSSRFFVPSCLRAFVPLWLKGRNNPGQKAELRKIQIYQIDPLGHSLPR